MSSRSDQFPVGRLDTSRAEAYRCAAGSVDSGVSSFGYQGLCFLFSAYIRTSLTRSSFKILVLIALIIFGLVVDLGGARLTNGEQRDVIGFRWWTPPAGPFGHAPMGASGSLNAFLGWWATMGMSLFLILGLDGIS